MARRVTFLIGLLLIVISLSSWQRDDLVVNASDGDDEIVPGEVVVKLRSVNELSAVASQYALNPTPLDQFGSRPIYRLRITDGVQVGARVTALSTDSRVVYAEPNFVQKPPEGGGNTWSVGNGWSVGGDAGAYLAQWAPQKMRLPIAHRVNRGTGPNGPIKIAVLDTGIDATHPALAGHLLPGRDFVDNDYDPSEVGSLQTGPYGHGTHVAGLIALVAPEAKIIPIRVLDHRGIGNIWVLAEALAYAVDPDGNPNTQDGADVINMSLSTLRRTRLIESVLAKVCGDTQEDDEEDFPAFSNPYLIIVAAAGNASNTTRQYPAAENVDGLIAVGASTSQDRLARFSSRGSWVHFSAPGQEILSTVPGGQYATWSGTSMAAPLVAGVAALVRATFPRLNNDDIVDHIEDTSKRIEGEVRDRIDAGAAVTTRPN